jgi:hypothetical protein
VRLQRTQLKLSAQPRHSTWKHERLLRGEVVVTLQTFLLRMCPVHWDAVPSWCEAAAAGCQPLSAATAEAPAEFADVKSEDDFKAVLKRKVAEKVPQLSTVSARLDGVDTTLCKLPPDITLA